MREQITSNPRTPGIGGDDASSAAALTKFILPETRARHRKPLVDLDHCCRCSDLKLKLLFHVWL